MVRDVALPPVSRKLDDVVGEERGGDSNRRDSTSFVFIANPAPLTSVPMRFCGSDPSGSSSSGGVGRGMYTIPDFSARSCASESWDVSRRAWMSDWRLQDLKAASSKMRVGLKKMGEEVGEMVRWRVVVMASLAL